MPRRRSEKKRRKTTGIEAIVKPGVEAVYTRGAWMKKLDDLDKGEREQIKRNKVKRKQR
ncbi:MAG: hypothetical protein ACE5IF_01445 [Candidatus Bathyarchaeia archaeon]